MWFGYNREITFCHFFHFVNLVIFRPQCIDSGYLVSATPHTILYPSFWNYAYVFSKFWRCAYGLDITLALIFVTFSTLGTLSFSDLRRKVYRQWVPCECISSYNFILIFLKLCTCFLHGLEMCMWFGYNPWMSLFSLCELCHFLTSEFMKVNRQWLLWAYLLYQNRFRFPKLSVPMVSTVSHKPKLVSLVSQNGQFQFSAILSIFWKMKIKCFYDIIVRFSFIGGPKWVTVNTLNYPHSNTIKTTTK